MSDRRVDSFGFLASCWPDLADLGRKAEQAEALEPDLVAIRLRGLTEAMAIELVNRLGLTGDPASSHFEKLVLLGDAGVFDPRLLSKFHVIRKLGNSAAHRGQVTARQATALLDDAWSLCCWFCRFMRPDLNWVTPPRVSAREAVTAAAAQDRASPERQPTPGDGVDMARGVDARTRRIRDDAAHAMAQVDPGLMHLRTSIALHEAFDKRLSQDQMACLTSLQVFLDKADAGVFLLKGHAGTGKTFLIAGLADYFAAQGRTFQLLAPTGRAAKVIAEKTGWKASTVHRSIYDFGDLQEHVLGDDAVGSETYRYYAQLSPNLSPADTVYIVDESSLVSDIYSDSEFFRCGSGFLLRDLMSYVGFGHSWTGRKIVFVGDSAQLPPVGMNTSPALDAEYLRQHFGVQPEGYELSEVQRQKAGSGVLRNVTPLRDSLSTRSFSSLNFTFDDDVRRLRQDDILPLYMAARATQGATAPIVIASSNAETASLNRAIRDVLFPGCVSVVPGDRLIATANGFAKGVFLANGEILEVEEVDPFIERRSVVLRQRHPETGIVDTVEVPLTFRELRLALTSTDGGRDIVRAKILNDHLHASRAGLDALQQRALYVDFLKRHPGLKESADRKLIGQMLKQDEYFSALRVRFGYAVTCHKAQGGEWPHVFVSCPTGRDPRTEKYFRWLYTAMTRSSAKLYLVDPPEVRISVVGIQPHAAEHADGSLSALQLFRDAVLAGVRGILDERGILIEDVAHNQYQEAFYLRRDLDTARVNIAYNGKLTVTGIAAAGGGAFGASVGDLLRPLIGQIGRPAASGAAAVAQPGRAFLAAFHDRLVTLLAARKIAVADLKEQAWSQRYTFAREAESAVVDIFYDGKNRLTRCMPVVGKRFGRQDGTLMPEVLEILTQQVSP